MEGRPILARRFVVRGVVQGVAFRWSTRRAAERLGVAGWVRKRPDGTVEAWAETDPARLDAFEAWLYDGPPAARVAAVESEPAEPAGLEGFEVRF
jgi:acylphosphatase